MSNLIKDPIAGNASSGIGDPARMITQSGHGFLTGELVYSDAGVYKLGLADDLATSLIVGMVSCPTNDTFILVSSGWVNTGTPLPPGGTQLYLSEVTAGSVTTSPPASPDYVAPVGIVMDSNSVLINLQLVLQGA